MVADLSAGLGMYACTRGCCDAIDAARARDAAAAAHSPACCLLAARSSQLLLAAPAASQLAASMEYVETFDEGPGGWFGRNLPLEVKDGVATSRSPWWIDAK